MSRYRILKDRVEPQPRPQKKKPEITPVKKMIRAREITDEGHLNWAVEADLIKNVKIVQRNVKTRYSKQYPDGYELVQAEYDIVDPKGEWSQKFHKKEWVKGDEGYEESGSYDNEFEIIYPENLETLEKLDMEALKEHLQTYYREEFNVAMDKMGETFTITRNDQEE